MLLIPNNGAIYFPIKGTTNNIPQTPYSTGGIAARTFTKGKTKFRNLLPAYSTKYTEAERHKGTAMIKAINVTQTVPMMKGRNPKFPFIGDQTLLLKMVQRDSVAIRGSALILKPTRIANITKRHIPNKIPERFLINLSFISL